MSIPNLFLGRADPEGVCAFDTGYTDAGEAYTARVRSNPDVLPDAGQERIYPAAYLTLEHRVPPAAGEPYDEVALTVAAVVDNVAVASRVLTVRLTPIADRSNPPARVRRTYEVPLSIPVMLDAVEVGRTPPRGRIFQLEVSWPASDVSIDGAHVEYDLVPETSSPAT